MGFLLEKNAILGRTLFDTLLASKSRKRDLSVTKMKVIADERPGAQRVGTDKNAAGEGYI
jgi:hypothetical protein